MVWLGWNVLTQPWRIEYGRSLGMHTYCYKRNADVADAMPCQPQDDFAASALHTLCWENGKLLSQIILHSR